MMSVINFLLLVFAIGATTRAEFESITAIKYFENIRIVSGKPASPGQFPFQVANQITRGGKQYFCGASLICDSWVITAAHCVINATNITLTFGAININNSHEPGRIVMVATEKHIHPQFKPPSINNDIALIRLPQKIRFTKRIQPIALEREYLFENVSAVAIGWGKTKDGTGNTSPNLNYVRIWTISNKECQKTYGPKIVPYQVICCKGRPKHSICNGDSGGPLIHYRKGKAFQIAIASFISSKGCESKHPSGYTRVTAYRRWIEKTIEYTCDYED